ncbi:hypothetical protein KEM54_005980, partial [Ascosphaera aggregata]
MSPPPAHKALVQALRDATARIYRTKSPENLTVKRIRTEAEKELGVEEGFFKGSAEWKDKSSTIIRDEVEIQESAQEVAQESAEHEEQPADVKKRKEEEEEEEEEDEQEKAPESISRKRASDRGKEGSQDSSQRKKRVKTKTRTGPVAKETSGDDEKEVASDERDGIEKDEHHTHSARRTRTKRVGNMSIGAAAVAAGSSPSERFTGPDQSETGKKHSPTIDEEANASSDSELSSLPDEEPPIEEEEEEVEVKAEAEAEAEAEDDDDDDSNEKTEEKPVKKGKTKKTKERSFTATTTTAATLRRNSKSKGKGRAKPAADQDPDTAMIKRLQSQLVQCGVRKMWYRELQPYDTPKQKIAHLKEMLKDVGMTGRFSQDKAKVIKERRELQEDLREIRGNAGENEEQEEEEEKDDDDDDNDKEGGKEDAEEWRKKRNAARRQ